MAENLGRATVFIGADIAELQKGLKQATQEVSSVAKSMTVALGAVTAVFSVGIASALHYGEEISRLSSITGITTETLSRLQYTAKQNEVSFDGLANGLKILARNVDEANTGNVNMAKNFSRLGVAASDLRGMGIDEMLYAVADRFKTLTSDSERTALAMDIFGRSGAGIIPILKLGSDGIKEFFEASDRLGNTLTGPQAKALKEFNDSIQDMQMYLRGIWVGIATEVGPAIENFLSALQKSNLLKDIAIIFKDILESVTELPALIKLAAVGMALFGTAAGRAL
ncbi:MAG: hypothetical protein Q8N91_04970, partial [Candidatus Omnitrophota bacterium]|nr:hypothetical protein [Candidatus Omnitrophota bacterium]